LTRVSRTIFSIIFSIDCSSFSTLGHAGQGRNEENSYLGEAEGLRCEEGNRLIMKALDLIKAQLERNPHFLFTIENPISGKMKDHMCTALVVVDAVLEAPRVHGGLGATRCVVDYCWFWDGVEGEQPFRKRTIIWTNSPTLIHELGAHAPPCVSHFLCERTHPCRHYRWHRPVAGNSATPRWQRPSRQDSPRK
jgi:hypothetical protein